MQVTCDLITAIKGCLLGSESRLSAFQTMKHLGHLPLHGLPCVCRKAQKRKLTERLCQSQVGRTLK